MGLSIGCATAIMTYGVDSAEHAGFGTESAAQLLAIASRSVVAMRLFVAFIATRREQAGIVLIPTMLAVGGLGHLALALQTKEGIVLGIVLGLVFGYGWAGVMFLFVARMFPTRTGRAGGVVMMGAYGGVVFATPAFGWVVDQSGFTVAWRWSSACVFVAATLLALALTRPRGSN